MHFNHPYRKEENTGIKRREQHITKLSGNSTLFFVGNTDGWK